MGRMSSKMAGSAEIIYNGAYNLNGINGHLVVGKCDDADMIRRMFPGVQIVDEPTPEPKRNRVTKKVHRRTKRYQKQERLEAFQLPAPVEKKEFQFATDRLQYQFANRLANEK